MEPRRTHSPHPHLQRRKSAFNRPGRIFEPTACRFARGGGGCRSSSPGSTPGSSSSGGHTRRTARAVRAASTTAVARSR
ncbi:unnamed protein product [Scytosiphon promiscuus]